jgi:predicted nucleic acid-binding protein
MQLIDTIPFSESTFRELQAVLNRPKFDRYIDDARRDRFLSLLQGSGVIRGYSADGADLP